MDGMLAAFGATGLYYIGFAVFKVAADRMEPLRSNRILRMIWVILGNRIAWIGFTLVLGGLALQIIALGKLALGVAVPIFVSGLVPLLAIALTVFGERLNFREWMSLLLVAAAMLLLALSIDATAPITTEGVAAWKLIAVALPPLALPLMLMLFNDYSPDGRHAKPVTGIAHGMSAGFPFGTAELAVKGWSDSADAGLGILQTPYPYLTVVAAGLGFGIIITGFQRCQMAIIASVMTISAKIYLLVVGTLLYGEPWPDAGQAVLRILALAMVFYAVLLFPRHQESARHDGAAVSGTGEQAHAAELPRPRVREDSRSHDPFAPAGNGRPSMADPVRQTPPPRDATGGRAFLPGGGRPQAPGPERARPQDIPRPQAPEPEWRRDLGGRNRLGESSRSSAPPGGRPRPVGGGGVRTPDVRGPRTAEVPLAAPTLPPVTGRFSTAEMPAVRAVPPRSPQDEPLEASGVKWAPTVETSASGVEGAGRFSTAETPVADPRPPRVPAGGRFDTSEMPAVPPQYVPADTGEMPAVEAEEPRNRDGGQERSRPPARVEARARTADDGRTYRPKYGRPR